MQKIDFKKELHHLYNPPAKNVVKVDVPKLHFLMMDGEGDPNSTPAYAEALETLFSLSYALKFSVKKSDGGVDYAVMPLEGLWWADDMATFTPDDKTNWKWTMMIMQPEFVSGDMVGEAMHSLQKKKDLQAPPKIRFEALAEGHCAQIMHIGPFAAERPAVEKVHHYIESTGHVPNGKHHEIYLSDIRKADPRRWKTIIRQPMR
jgi:hypothetical protein